MTYNIVWAMIHPHQSSHLQSAAEKKKTGLEERKKM